MAERTSPTSSGPSRRRLAREERRALILDAAGRVILERDPTEVTLEEIADAAGVSRALIYNYFADRHALLEALGTRIAEAISAQVRDVLSEVHGGRAALEASVRVHLAYAARDPSGYRLAFTGSDAARQVWIRHTADLLGAGDEGRLLSAGLAAAAGTLVVTWTESDVALDRAAELITSLLAGAFAGLDAVGVPLVPVWTVPDQALV